MTRLTTNSQETTLGDLLSVGTSLYLIPFFQREYRWSPEKVRNLKQDILNVVDGLTDKHFLGAVIVHGRRANPTDPRVFEVIDGQQRLTTAFLFLCALVKTLASSGEVVEAAKIARNYLQIGSDYRHSNLRIHSCRLDRSMMNSVIEDIKSEKEFLEELSPHELNSLPSYGPPRGPMRNNYNSFKRFFRDEMDQGGIERIREIYGVFLSNFTVVQIDVLDPTDGPKIFDSLNSQQEPMRISDLVRNEIFRKIADEPPEKIERIDEEVWQPFYASFEDYGANTFDRFLFPYALISDPNLRKSEVFTRLRDSWSKVDNPAEIIKSLDRFKFGYLDTLFGGNESNFPKELAKAYSRLSALNAPSSILPFTMQLAKAVSDETVEAEAAHKMLSVVESFLVRRAICGYEPTGLHAVFKRLWADLGGKYSPDAVAAAISSHKTVTWPDKAELREAIRTRPLYGSGITPFFLLEYDRQHGGDAHEHIETIEHVLPQSAGEEWKKLYGEKQVGQDKDALPNLVPCSGQMNSSLGNQPYAVKRERFAADSKFKSTRQFAKDFPTWDKDMFQKRASMMGEWATKCWPHDRSAAADEE